VQKQAVGVVFPYKTSRTRGNEQADQRTGNQQAARSGDRFRF